jgi:hypothetical protein
MADLVPRGDRIDRAALERIIRRAAELQAGEREIGEGLTERELIALGDDVGIPAHLLQQALVEERTRAAVTPERGVAAWLAGPRIVSAQRTVAQAAGTVDKALQHWMAEGELLSVKRRFADRIAWEAKRGAMVSLKRSLGAGGRRYHLAAAREVITAVTGLDATRCHVSLTADLSDSRRNRLAGAAGLTVTGAGVGAVGLTLGVAAPVAVVPLLLGGLLAFATARHRLADVERTMVALEQVLDRLQHGEIRPPATSTSGAAVGPLERVAQEIRRTFGIHIID